MNTKTPHIRVVALYALILLGFFAILTHARATPLEDKLKDSENKIMSHLKDLSQVSHNLHGTEALAEQNLESLAKDTLCDISRVQDPLVIIRHVHDDNDRRWIVEFWITDRINALDGTIDTKVEIINGSMELLHNQAVILTASKLIDDLRELKGLPKPVP
jgi:hypothetical protein